MILRGFAGLRKDYVEKTEKVINHSTVLTGLSTVFTVEKVENFSPICTKNTAARSEPPYMGEYVDKLTIYRITLRLKSTALRKFRLPPPLFPLLQDISRDGLRCNISAAFPAYRRA